MIREHIEKLCKELAIEMPKMNEYKIFPIPLGTDLIAFRDLDPGLSLQAKICAIPQRKKEELFIYLMRANLLGQGTGGARIGINPEEKFLTLSSGLPYELNYQIFRDAVEDFVNYVIYWRDEVAKFENEESVY